jgi:trigger factor
MSGADVDHVLTRLAEQNRTYTPKGDEGAADGDMVVIDFVGRVDGEAFEGGSAEDTELVLGAGRFIPGFEEQMEGMKSGESRTIVVTFPENYSAAKLVGKAATFNITLKGAAAPAEVEIGDEFARALASRISASSRTDPRECRARSSGGLARKMEARSSRRASTKICVRRAGRDGGQESDAVWRTVEAEQKRSGRSYEDDNTTEAAARADYPKIAERRVRLPPFGRNRHKAEIRFRRGGQPSSGSAGPRLSRPGKDRGSITGKIQAP